jgi:hypothetical protein
MDCTRWKLVARRSACWSRPRRGERIAVAQERASAMKLPRRGTAHGDAFPDSRAGAAADRC